MATISLLAVTSPARRALRIHLDRMLEEQAGELDAHGHDVEVHVVEGTKPCGMLRAEAMKKATGDYVAWIDDDDWINPRRTLQLLDRQAELVVSGRFSPGRWWGLGPKHLTCWDVERDLVGKIATALPVFAAGLYHRERVASVRWSPQPAGSDTRWLQAAQLARGGQHLAALPDFPDDHGLYALHAANTGNRTRRSICTISREQWLREHGHEAALEVTRALLADLRRL